MKNTITSYNDFVLHVVQIIKPDACICTNAIYSLTDADTLQGSRTNLTSSYALYESIKSPEENHYEMEISMVSTCGHIFLSTQSSQAAKKVRTSQNARVKKM